MKQEYISTFLIKTSGMFSVEDTMKLQDLLQTTKDDAFPILMAINTPTTRGNIKRLAICIALLVISLFYAIGFTIQFIIHAVEYNNFYADLLIPAILFFAAFITLTHFTKIWYDNGKLKYVPKNKRLYIDYINIIKSYQENVSDIRQ